MDIMPSQDAIAEFTMMTSNYPPDYGISSGATMSLSLKSGTQKFHGEAMSSTATPTTTPTDYSTSTAALAAPTPTTTSLGSTRVVRCSFPMFTTRASRRHSFSGTRSGARFWPAPAPTNEPTIDPADIPKSQVRT